jgi:hypothetical protein
LPDDPFFSLAATTLHVDCAMPCEVGNHLIQFFGEMVITSALKLNQQKFSLKADVFIENVPCTIKVRFFQTAQKSFAVEFQRKRGDGWSFGTCYQLAARFLHQRCPDVAVPFGPEATLLEASVCRDSPHAPAALDGSDVSPLLDMAGNRRLPVLQAESACVLAAIAESGGLVASGLVSDSAFDQFQVLLQTDNLDVQYSTARMLCFLAAMPEARLMFAKQGLLPIMVDRVREAVSMLRLQQQMSQALCAAVLQCAALLSEQLARELMTGLAEILRASEVEQNGQVYQALSEAHSALTNCAKAPAA